MFKKDNSQKYILFAENSPKGCKFLGNIICSRKGTEKWQDVIFKEQPYLANVYPGDTKDIGIIFCIDSGEIEYFNLGVNPMFREIYPLGNATIKPKGYYITEACISCGKCKVKCPQRVVHIK